MIPLSRWLTDHENGARFDCPPDPGYDDGKLSPACPEELAGTPVPSREEELEDSLRAAEENLMAERLSHAQREQDLREELGAELANRLKSQIERGLTDLSQTLETALADILRPFLTQQSIRQALAALMNLIETEVRNQGQPLLEVVAPPELHGVLAPALEQAKISTTLSEGTHITLAFTASKMRFEQLALRWHEIITEPAHEG